METKLDLLTKTLCNKNIRLSYRRNKVLEYLCENPDHPTVGQIYDNLHYDVPNLSKTTVYNTLNILIEAGLVRVINIEDNETRYDILTEDHGHFKCEKCGEIQDFDIDIDSFETKGLSDFKILDKNVYFKGVCPKCL